MQRRLVAVLVTGLTFPCGCDRPAGPTPTGPTATPAPPADVAARPPDGFRTPLFDGFEGDALAAFWRPGDYGSGRFAPGAVALSTDYARSGRGSVRITVTAGDVQQTGDDGRPTERAELDSGKFALGGRDVWYGFSALIPPGFPVVDNRLVLAQWKQNGVSGPLVAQRFRAGRHDLTVQTPGAAADDKKRYRLPDLVPGRWTDFVYHIRYSPAADGRVEVWADGTRVVSHAGATTFGGGEDRFYNKVGLYRDRWAVPMTIYFDNYTLGDGFAAVDPARFDRPQ